MMQTYTLLEIYNSNNINRNNRERGGADEIIKREGGVGTYNVRSISQPKCSRGIHNMLDHERCEQWLVNSLFAR